MTCRNAKKFVHMLLCGECKRARPVEVVHAAQETLHVARFDVHRNRCANFSRRVVNSHLIVRSKIYGTPYAHRGLRWSWCHREPRAPASTSREVVITCVRERPLEVRASART